MVNRSILLQILSSTLSLLYLKRLRKAYRDARGCETFEFPGVRSNYAIRSDRLRKDEEQGWNVRPPTVPENFAVQREPVKHILLHSFYVDSSVQLPPCSPAYLKVLTVASYALSSLSSLPPAHPSLSLSLSLYLCLCLAVYGLWYSELVSSPSSPCINGLERSPD